MDGLTNQASENSFSDKAIVDGAYSIRTEKKCKEVQGPSSVNPPELVPYLPHNILVHGLSRCMKSVSFSSQVFAHIYIYIYSIYLK
jgi:hypothetical protein